MKTITSLISITEDMVNYYDGDYFQLLLYSQPTVTAELVLMSKPSIYHTGERKEKKLYRGKAAHHFSSLRCFRAKTWASRPRKQFREGNLEVFMSVRSAA